MADAKSTQGEHVESRVGSPGANKGVVMDATNTKPPGRPNPMWKYMGLGENFRPKLPSRNWTIFLTITGTFTAAIIYDKRETKRAQRKWCKLVEHIAKEPLDPRAMPRKLTIFLEGPPTDGLRVAQDHFKEYVKPILVASGLDWEFIQGRKEGDVRAELAERIRNSRLPLEEQIEDDLITEVRKKAGIIEFNGPRGDIVIGRHTWKEYVRGLHEGWLGPLIEPPRPVVEKSQEEKDLEPTLETLPGITIHSSPEEARKALLDTPTSDDTTENPTSTPKTEDKPKKPDQISPFITPLEYPTAPTISQLPSEFDPSTPITFPHILGFLNTPKRLYRFLNRRVLADQIGRETAAVILSTYRPYSTSDALAPPSFQDDMDASSRTLDSDQSTESIPQTAEQQTALIEEEKEWHKSTRVRVDGEPERTWLEPIILDPRIASRMRRFELTPEDEAKANSIVVPEEEIEGWIKGSLRGLARSGKLYFGYGKPKKAEATEDETVLE